MPSLNLLEELLVYLNCETVGESIIFNTAIHLKREVFAAFLFLFNQLDWQNVSVASYSNILQVS